MMTSGGECKHNRVHSNSFFSRRQCCLTTILAGLLFILLLNMFSGSGVRPQFSRGRNTESPVDTNRAKNGKNKNNNVVTSGTPIPASDEEESFLARAANAFWNLDFDMDGSELVDNDDVKDSASGDTTQVVPCAAQAINGTESPPTSPEPVIPLKVLLKNLSTPTLQVPDKERANLSVKDLAIVTFASLNHMSEAILSCDSFRRIAELRKTPYFVYLNQDVSADVELVYKQLCPIATVRRYPAPGYDPMLKDLKNYRFKAIIQAEVLKESKVVLYVDSSLRANTRTKTTFDAFIKTQIKLNKLDLSFILSPGHKIFPATHPDMFKFYPKVDPTRTQTLPQFGSGALLWVGSKAGWRVMSRFLACSIEPACMGPPGAVTTCNRQKIYNNPKSFSGCHRFDQASLNLVMVEESGYNATVYKANTDVIVLHRRLDQNAENVEE